MRVAPSWKAPEITCEGENVYHAYLKYFIHSGFGRYEKADGQKR